MLAPSMSLKGPSWTRWFFFFALLVAPFYFVSFFARPSNDDFEYVSMVRKFGFWPFQAEYYRAWTGRYFSNFLEAANPFTQGYSGFYPWMGFGLLAFWQLGLFTFLKSTLGKCFRNLELLTISFAIFALFLHRLAKVSDSFYWMAGAISHSVGMILGLFSLAFYLSVQNNGIRRESLFWQSVCALILMICSVCIVGSNETLMLQWSFFLAWLFGFFWYVHGRKLWSLWPALLASAMGAVIVIIAPGNGVRSSRLEGGKNIWLMFVKPIGLMVEIIPRYLSVAGIILVFVLIGLAPEFRRRLPPWFYERRARLAFLALCLVLLWLTFLPSVWAWGGLPPKRVMNNTYFWMLMTFPIVLLQNLPRGFGWLANTRSFFLRVIPQPARPVIFILAFLLPFNHFDVWQDLVRGPEYAEQIRQREELMAAHKGEDVILPALKNPPVTILYEDISTNPADGQNQVYAEFFGVKSVRIQE